METALDFVLNGQGYGDIGSRLSACGYDHNCLKPYIAENGRPYINVVRNGKVEPVLATNANATLRKDEWLHVDRRVIEVARQRLRFVQDLMSAGLTYNIPNGMGTTVLQHQAQGDINDAIWSMDGLRKGNDDALLYSLENLPLPIVHKDFGFSRREIETSRRYGMPIDTTMAEMSARKVAEAVESQAIGTVTGMTYGGGTIYGARTFPSRITKTITQPSLTSGWTPNITVNQVLDMRQASRDAKYHGPWMLYNSASWDKYMDDDYSQAKGVNTLRQRLKAIDGIMDVRTLDYLTSYDLLLIQMTSDVVRMVNGLSITTLQWEPQPLEVRFKVMAIMVPQYRADFNGNTGLVHASV